MPMEPGNKYDEQMADRHAATSGEDEKQHDEDRMRDIHFAKKRTSDSR